MSVVCMLQLEGRKKGICRSRVRHLHFGINQILGTLVSTKIISIELGTYILELIKF